MHVRQIPVAALSERDLDRWQELGAEAIEPNPFFEPQLVLPAVEGMEQRERVSLLVVEDDDSWHVCMPVGPYRIARLTAALGTWRHPYGFLGTPLARAELLLEALEAVLNAAVGRGSTGLFVFDRIGADGPMAEALREVCRRLRLEGVLELRHERALLVRREEASYLTQERPHRRRELQRLGRRLEEELGKPLEVVDLAGSEESVETFLDLESSGWKGHRGTALGSSPLHARFFREVCDRFARESRLQLLCLKAGERPVAMKCNLLSPGGGFCFKIAHDHTLRQFSPGVQLERANIEIFHQARTEPWLDSCADPDNGMINRLWPDRRAILTTAIARRGPRATISRRALRLRRTKERSRSSTTS